MRSSCTYHTLRSKHASVKLRPCLPLQVLVPARRLPKRRVSHCTQLPALPRDKAQCHASAGNKRKFLDTGSKADHNENARCEL